MGGYLVPDKSHDAYACKYVLPADRLAGNTIRVSGAVGIIRLTQVPHKQVHICTEKQQTITCMCVYVCVCVRFVLEGLFWYGLEVPHLPVAVEGIWWGHAKPHDRVEEGFALARVEAQNLPCYQEIKCQVKSL